MKKKASHEPTPMTVRWACKHHRGSGQEPELAVDLRLSAAMREKCGAWPDMLLTCEPCGLKLLRTVLQIVEVKRPR